MSVHKQLLRRQFSSLSTIQGPLDNKSIVRNVLFLLESLTCASVVGIYYPIKQEPDITKLIDIVKYKVFALPKINDENTMDFVTYDKSDTLLENRFNIPEPVNGEIVIPDAFIVPGMAFSRNGYRLGYGGGYYDKYFAINRNKCIIGVCLWDRLLENLPHDPHDQKTNVIVTDKEILLVHPL